MIEVFLNFREWFLFEDKGILAYKKQNPKNPSEYFIVLYGDTFGIKDILKKEGFKYFSGTWSIKEKDALAKPSVLDLLASYDIDINSLAGKEETAPTEPVSKEEQETDEVLEKMHTSINQALKETDDPQAKQLLQKIDDMIDDLAKSTDEAAQQKFIKNFLAFSSKFYNYSFHNQILIWIQTKGKASYVMAASKWPKLGRQVSKWNEGITIIRPNFVNKEREVVNPVTGQLEKDKFQLKFFKPTKVYDVSATEAIPGHQSPFQPVERKDWSIDSNEAREEISFLINGLMDWIKENNIDVDTEELGSETGGYSAGGKIRVNNTFAGVNFLSTLAHEAAHELLHWKDLKDEISTNQQKEIDAESVAYIVCKHFGFESKDSPNYLALWRAKGENIRERRKFIQETSKTIIEGIKNHLMKKDIDFGEDDA